MNEILAFFVAIYFLLFAPTHSQSYSYPSEARNIPPPQEKVFTATAYCQQGITKSGVTVAPGQVATDPDVIPINTRIYLDAPGDKYDGEYLATDTGRLVKGNHVDIFIPDYETCIEFGRQSVTVEVIE